MDSMEMVDVLLAGTLLPDADPDRAVEALVRLSGITPDQARILVTSGKPRLVKRNLTPEAGRNLMERLGAMGIKTVMRPATGPHNTVPAPASPRQAAPAPPPAPKPDELPRTAAGPERAARSAMPAPRPESEAGEHNPYAPPRATLARERAAAGEWRERGRVTPAGHGLKWIRDAWALFRSRPATWCGVMLLYGLCIVLLSLIPLLGALVTIFLAPVFSGGIALTAHEQSEGGEIGMGGLFRGFGPRFGGLALVGFFLLLVELALGVVALAIIGGPILFAAMSGNLDPAILQPAAGRIIALVPLYVLGLVPVMLALFFAPTLVAAGGHGAGQAMRAGIGAGVRNWKAGLVNFIGLVGFGIGVGLAFGVVSALLGALVGGENAPIFVAVFMVIGLFLWLPVGAVLTLMSYTATRDIFYDGDDER